MVVAIPELAAHLFERAGEGGGPPVEVTGPRHVLPAVFDVTGVATAAVGAAAAAVAELAAMRTGRGSPAVTVDTHRVSASFRSEQLFTPTGWERPLLLDQVIGDYRTADGWIRLHTNYDTHRRAALGALGLPDDASRDDVAAAVAARPAAALEQAVVDAGGAAAAMHSTEVWRRHEHGRATAEEPPLRVRPAPVAPTPHWAAVAVDRPLSGIRVLDLTRVIAGPVCTRVLAAFGADVLRLDPPGFADVPAIVPDTTPGKRCAALDLRSDDGRRRFGELVAAADVVVHGLRPGAMEGLGFGTAALRDRNPGIVTARLDAYGWQGPWAARRGFDSLVQMSTGIAAAADAERPVPLPAQALDHGTGYLLAAAVVRGLARLLATGVPADVTASLLGTAGVVLAHVWPEGIGLEAPTFGPADTIPVDTAWGPARAVPCPVRVTGWPPRWDIPAGPLGRHDAMFG